MEQHRSEQPPRPATYSISTDGAEAYVNLLGIKLARPLAVLLRRALIDRVLKGLFVGFCLAFGIAFCVFAYAIVFDLRGLIEVTSFRLTQLGLVVMLNLVALFVRDHI